MLTRRRLIAGTFAVAVVLSIEPTALAAIPAPPPNPWCWDRDPHQDGTCKRLGCPC